MKRCSFWFPFKHQPAKFSNSKTEKATHGPFFQGRWSSCPAHSLAARAVESRVSSELEAAEKGFNCSLGNLCSAEPHGGLLPFQDAGKNRKRKTDVEAVLRGVGRVFCCGTRKLPGFNRSCGFGLFFVVVAASELFLCFLERGESKKCTFRFGFPANTNHKKGLANLRNAQVAPKILCRSLGERPLTQ